MVLYCRVDYAVGTGSLVVGFGSRGGLVVDSYQREFIRLELYWQVCAAG